MRRINNTGALWLKEPWNLICGTDWLKWWKVVATQNNIFPDDNVTGFPASSESGKLPQAILNTNKQTIIIIYCLHDNDDDDDEQHYSLSSWWWWWTITSLNAQTSPDCPVDSVHHRVHPPSYCLTSQSAHHTSSSSTSSSSSSSHTVMAFIIIIIMIH